MPPVHFLAVCDMINIDMTNKDEKWFRYVPYWREAAYEKAGWQFCSPLPPPHSCYSSLYEWPGPGEPVEPEPPEEKRNNQNGEQSADI